MLMSHLYWQHETRFDVLILCIRNRIIYSIIRMKLVSSWNIYMIFPSLLKPITIMHFTSASPFIIVFGRAWIWFFHKLLDNLWVLFRTGPRASCQVDREWSLRMLRVPKISSPVLTHLTFFGVFLYKLPGKSPGRRSWNLRIKITFSYFIGLSVYIISDIYDGREHHPLLPGPY